MRSRGRSYVHAYLHDLSHFGAANAAFEAAFAGEHPPCRALVGAPLGGDVSGARVLVDMCARAGSGAAVRRGNATDLSGMGLNVCV